MPSVKSFSALLKWPTACVAAQRQTARLPISSRSGAHRNTAAMPALYQHNANANELGGASMALTPAGNDAAPNALPRVIAIFRNRQAK